MSGCRSEPRPFDFKHVASADSLQHKKAFENVSRPSTSSWRKTYLTQDYYMMAWHILSHSLVCPLPGLVVPSLLLSYSRERDEYLFISRKRKFHSNSWVISCIFRNNQCKLDRVVCSASLSYAVNWIMCQRLLIDPRSTYPTSARHILLIRWNN